MARCKFCQREFRSVQGVKAHLKHCERYQLTPSKKARALGTVPKAVATPPATPPVHATPPIAAPDLSAPLREFAKSMTESSTNSEALRSPQQQRRHVLQAAKAQVIDRSRSWSGTVTASMRGAAKAAIERGLANLPLEELPFEEVIEIAAATRDRCYAPAFTRQARDATRQRVEEELRHKQERVALGALIRADRRKKTFVLQTSQQAQAYCEEKAIVGWAQLRVVGDIESRLDAFLTGEESITEAQAIVQSVLDVRFAEADAQQAAAQAKAAEQWREELAGVLALGVLLAVPLLALRYPEQVVAILRWLERTFGLTPEDGATTPDASATSPPAASADTRPPSTRRRKESVSPSSSESPWGNTVGFEPGHA